MMEKIFESKNKRKIRIPTLSVKKKIAEQMIDKMKQHQIKNLANLALKKFDKNYVEKLSVLLHGSKNSPNYTYKRNNINKSVLIYNQTTNALDLALPKTYKDFENNKKKNYLNTYSNKINKKSYNFIRDNIKKNLNNMRHNKNNKNNKNNTVSKEKLKNIYSEIKNKYVINSNTNKITDNYENSPQLKDLKRCDFPDIKNNTSKNKIIKQNDNTNYTIDEKLKTWKLNYATPTQKEKLEFLSDLNIPSSINTFRKCQNTSGSSKKINNKKIKKINFSELCHYEKKKCQKNSVLFLKKIPKIKEINRESRNQLRKMITDISKLKTDVDQQQEDVNILIQKNNYFLKSLGIETPKLKPRQSLDTEIKLTNKKNYFSEANKEQP